MQTLAELKAHYGRMFHDNIGRVAGFNPDLKKWEWFYGTDRKGWRKIGSSVSLSDDATEIKSQP